ncbi:MAG: ribose 5-phosphate isomerase B [Sphingomonadales bacterium]|nr:ribose 5-phosphate isomerase B [Sphingomonadales bacterium]
MSQNKIAIASDHGGFALKQQLLAVLKSMDYEVLDLGCYDENSVDYPEFGHAMAEAIEGGSVEKGIIICGSGIGISIAANRHAGIRAALCTSGLMARLSRQHNNANVLALGARIIGFETAMDCMNEFLNTEFEGGRHQTRIEKI